MNYIENRLKEIIDLYGLKHWARFAQKDRDFTTEIDLATANLSHLDLSFTEKVLACLHGDPTCPLGNIKKYKSITSNWSFCGKTGKCKCASEIVSRKCKTNIDHEARLAKTSATLKSRYGNANPGQSPSAKKAHKKFYENAVKVSTAVEKGKQTMLSRYGVDNAFKLDIDREAIARRHWSPLAHDIILDKDKFESFMTDKSVTTAALLLGVNATTINNYIRKYDIRSSYGSSFENEIASFLHSNNIGFKSRDRKLIKPLELDFFIPEHNLAIEFNGLYYHSDEVVKNDFHKKKWEMCNRAGIRLLMINEDEWVERREIIELKILVLCGKGPKGIGARKLKIREISTNTAKHFIDLHHLQGSPGPCISAFGAFDQNDIMVGAMTFGRVRGTLTTELTRFCSDGKIYAGMFSKILRFARMTHTETIVSFADLRYSDGNLYSKNGFTSECYIRPDYKYVKRGKTYHKSLFSKKRITEKFGMDMTSRTEHSAMKELGYHRIYDCGKIRYRIG